MRKKEREKGRQEKKEGMTAEAKGGKPRRKNSIKVWSNFLFCVT